MKLSGERNQEPSYLKRKDGGGKSEDGGEGKYVSEDGGGRVLSFPCKLLPTSITYLLRATAKSQ